jgi:hypothetical protein
MMELSVLLERRKKRVISRTRRIKFDDLVTDLKEDHTLRGLRTWDRREFCLARLKPVFGGLLVSGITTERLKGYITKRLREKARQQPLTVNSIA